MSKLIQNLGIISFAIGILLAVSCYLWDGRFGMVGFQELDAIGKILSALSAVFLGALIPLDFAFRAKAPKGANEHR